MTERLSHAAPLWRWTGGNGPGGNGPGGNGTGWFFVTIDGEAGDHLSATALMRRLEGAGATGFGSIRVTARIGDSQWQTSVFPSRETGGYLLPVKRAVRQAEGIGEGDLVELVLEV